MKAPSIIIPERDEEGRYAAACSGLPGCISEGDTPEEAIQHINEAIPGCITSRLTVAAGSVHLPPVDRTVTISLDISGPTYA